MTDQPNSSGERYIAVNQCTKKVYGFIPDSWALVDTECHNMRRATGSREAMQFLEKELNTRATEPDRVSISREFYEDLLQLATNAKEILHVGVSVSYLHKVASHAEDILEGVALGERNRNE